MLALENNKSPSLELLKAEAESSWSRVRSLPFSWYLPLTVCFGSAKRDSGDGEFL
jgi:hypothetical protein